MGYGENAVIHMTSLQSLRIVVAAVKEAAAMEEVVAMEAVVVEEVLWRQGR